MTVMMMKHLITIILLIIAVFDDIRNYKIHNSTVLAGLTAGFAINFAEGGLYGLAESLLSAIIPAATLFVLFALRMIGAGDIKLLCSVGAIMRMKFVLYSIAFSFLAGGFMAVGIMLARRNVRVRLLHIGTYLKTIYLSHSFVPYTDFDAKSDGAKFHFALAIAAGCGAQIILGFL